MTEPRIYVADLAAYNNGKLHGIWIDAADDLDTIQEQVDKMLAESFAEEYAVHDYEGFDGYSLSEYENIQTVREIACFIEEYPDIAGELLNHFDGSLEDTRKAIEENYSSCYKSLADFAEELTEGSIQIPENITYDIDYERMGCDMDISGDIYPIKPHTTKYIFFGITKKFGNLKAPEFF